MVIGAPAAPSSQYCRAVGLADGSLAEHERIDGRLARDIQMIVAEVDADRRAGGRRDAVKLQLVSVALENGDRVRPIVDDGDEPACVLPNVPGVAADAALACVGSVCSRTRLWPS